MNRHFVSGVLAIGSAAVAVTAQATILPENNLYLEDVFEQDSNITQDAFNAIIQRARDIYAPVVEGHDATLSIRGKWDDSTVNASASQLLGAWQVNMYGGLARRPEVTPDGFVLVLCHEIGHHLGGFPFVSSWGANEGQADYFATTHCAQQFWGEERAINATYRDVIPAGPKARCDGAWSTQDAQNLCYRTLMAGKSLANLLAALREQAVDFATPDQAVVTETFDDHPDAQCRLDTYVAGALCVADYVIDAIPGKRFGPSRNGIDAERESAQHYCADQVSDENATRPLCWFHPAI